MASGSFNFTTNNQYIVGKVSWTSTPNTANNSSSVTATVTMWRTNSGYTTDRIWNTTLTINGNGKTEEKRHVLTYNSNTTIMTHTVTVPHNADGTKSITINIRGYSLTGGYTITSTNGTAKLDTIPRASQPRLSSSSRAIGQSVTIYTDRASSSFTHTITYKIGATTGTIGSSVGDSVTWTVPDVSNRITNSTSGTCTITCVTKSGSTTIGTKTVNLTITIPNAAPYLPTVSSITTSMVRGPGAPSGMTAYVSGYSKISASMSGASAGRNASITSYKLTINGVTYNSSSATSGVISKSGTVTVTAQITDSRGRTSTAVTKDITFTAYKPPSITTFNAARQSTSTTIKVDWAVSYLNITGNSVTTKIETKQSTASSWSVFQANTTATSGSKNLTGVSDLVTQQFRLTSTDSFGNSASRIISVGTAKVAFSIGKNEGIGAGKVWERGALDVGGYSYYANSMVLPNDNGTKAIIKPSGYVGLALGVPGSNSNTDTTGAALQLYHDGRLISSGSLTAGNITISGYTAVDRHRGRTAANQFYIGDGNCRVDTSIGAIRLYTTAIGASSDSGIRVDANGALNVIASGVTRHSFASNGTKSGGTIEVEGTTYGMSPIDSPQVLIEDVLFDVYVDGRTEIQLDNIFAKAISKFAVFSNCGQVEIVEKGEDYFVVDGYTGKVDFRIVGKRVYEEHRYFEIMGGFEHGVAEEVNI